ncbi:MAG: adenylate/guanylate cyclase domain-containing protein [Actinomycetes bacterium]
MRVGINTGEALVRLDVAPGSGEGFLTGDAINTASRIQSLAPVGGVAVGQTTFDVTAAVFEYDPLEPAKMKGKSTPVAVFHAKEPLARLGTDLTRTHDSQFVGREIDLALMKGIFDKTVAAAVPARDWVTGTGWPTTSTPSTLRPPPDKRKTSPCSTTTTGSTRGRSRGPPPHWR